MPLSHSPFPCHCQKHIITPPHHYLHYVVSHSAKLLQICTNKELEIISKENPINLQMCQETVKVNTWLIFFSPILVMISCNHCERDGREEAFHLIKKEGCVRGKAKAIGFFALFRIALSSVTPRGLKLLCWRNSTSQVGCPITEAEFGRASLPSVLVFWK